MHSEVFFVYLSQSCRHCRQGFYVGGMYDSVECPYCHSENPVQEVLWGGMLQDAIDSEEGFRTEMNTYLGHVQIEMGRASPSCLQCRAPVRKDALERADEDIPCLGCGASISCREPFWLDVRGLKAVVGEHWRTALPANEPHCWFLVYDQSLGTVWGELLDAAFDRRRERVYGLSLPFNEGGFSTGEVPTLWAMTLEQEMLWVRDDVILELMDEDELQGADWGDFSFDDNHLRLAMMEEGVLGMFFSGKHSLLRLSCDDGRTLEKRKGRATRSGEPGFSMKGCSGLARAKDGSFLIAGEEHSTGYGRLHRMDVHGTRLPTWPRKRWEREAPFVRHLFSYPSLFYDKDVRVHVGLDGAVYFHQERDRDLAKFEPTGKRIYATHLPDIFTSLWADEGGEVYILPEGQKTHIAKVSPDGRLYTPLFPLGDGSYEVEEDFLWRSEKGHFVLLGSEGRLRIIDAHGRQLTCSEASARDDLEKQEESHRQQRAISSDFEDPASTHSAALPAPKKLPKSKSILATSGAIMAFGILGSFILFYLLLFFST